MWYPRKPPEQPKRRDGGAKPTQTDFVYFQVLPTATLVTKGRAVCQAEITEVESHDWGERSLREGPSQALCGPQ